MKTQSKPICIHCGQIIIEGNISPSYLKRECYICTPCNTKIKRKWAQKNPERTRMLVRERMRRWRELNPDKAKKASQKAEIKRVANGKLKEYSSRYHKANRKIANAQFKAWKAQMEGLLVKQPCIICGDQKSEKHHPDYNKPLEIVWLCSKHHRRLHRWIN